MSNKADEMAYAVHEMLTEKNLICSRVTLPTINEQEIGLGAEINIAQPLDNATKKALIKKYEADKILIDKNNLIEISFNSFVKNPVDQTKKIYEKFSLLQFKDKKEEFRKYYEIKKNYIYGKNREEKI